MRLGQAEGWPATRFLSRWRLAAVGLLILLGAVVGPTSAWADGNVYIVQEGDTLFAIARRYGLDLDQVLELNGLAETDIIVVGQELLLTKPAEPAPAAGGPQAPTAVSTPSPTPAVPPTATPVASGGGVYVVQQGDTLTSIASRVGLSWPRLAAANGLVNADRLKVGQKLVVPGSGQPVSPTGPALLWPAAGPITTYFGDEAPYYYSGRHTGIDIAANTGAPVGAAAAGRVIAAVKLADGYGWHLLVDHGDGYTTLYAHLCQFKVKEGEQVAAGQVIGAVGNTGFSLGPHLHFEVRRFGVPQNPLAYLP